MLFRKTVSAMLMLLALMQLSATLLGCSPVLDWREFEPEGSGVIVTFPCRPDRHARDVAVAGVTTRMTMLVCAAADVTYALTYIDVAEPAGVTAALADLRAVAAGNLAATRAEPNPLQVTGMTPNPLAARLHLSGSRTDGAAVQQQAAFFAKGLRVYQASAVGTVLSAEAVDTFFAGLKLAS